MSSYFLLEQLIYNLQSKWWNRDKNTAMFIWTIYSIWWRDFRDSLKISYYSFHRLEVGWFIHLSCKMQTNQEWYRNCIIMMWLLQGAFQWHHNEHNGITNHQPHDYYSRCRSKKIWKLHVTGICGGKSLVTGEFPTQRARNTKKVSIWWRHHENIFDVHE